MTREIIKLSKSIISDLEKKAVLRILDKEYLGMGEEVANFEKILENFFGKTAICVVNGTAALHLALQAHNIGPDDEVLIQSITYVASIQAITATGAKPIFCDIRKDTLTIDIEDAKKKITCKTKAIMPVHYAGGVGNLDEVYNFAKQNNLIIIEDAAHAFGTTYKGTKVGSFGHTTCFSFDGIKNITSGEGGCVVSSDKNVINKIKDARLLGVENDTQARYSNKRSWEFDVKNQGWRYHMSNIMASIGIVQMSRFEEFILIKKELAKLYFDKLKNFEEIKLLNIDRDNTVMHIFPILLENSFLRNNLKEYLLEKRIQTGLHYYPNHLLSFFKNESSNGLPNTSEIYQKLLTLPFHPDLKTDDINYIVNQLKLFFERNK